MTKGSGNDNKEVGMTMRNGNNNERCRNDSKGRNKNSPR